MCRLAALLLAPARAGDARDGDTRRMPLHRGAKGVPALVAARLGQRTGEQTDPPVAVLDQMVDEQRHPMVVVEDDRAVADPVDRAVEEDAGHARA